MTGLRWCSKTRRKPDSGSLRGDVFSQFFPESVQQTRGAHAGCTWRFCTPYLIESPDSPVQSWGSPPFFIPKMLGLKEVKPWAQRQEMVELARFSLAKGSAPATRAQLFPHDKLLQLLIRHLRSQYSHGGASL